MQYVEERPQRLLKLVERGAVAPPAPRRRPANGVDADATDWTVDRTTGPFHSGMDSTARGNETSTKGSKISRS